jgi:predicted DNA-binding transcriptional regulator AlpA
MDAVQQYMTTAEVAHQLRQPESTVRYWRHIGYGPSSVKLGRRVLYDPAEVAQWVSDEHAAQIAARNGAA